MPNPTPALDRPLKSLSSHMHGHSFVELKRTGYSELFALLSRQPTSPHYSERPREDSNSHSQAADDSSQPNPMQETPPLSPVQLDEVDLAWGLGSLLPAWEEYQFRPFWRTPGPHGYYGSTTLDADGSCSNGGHTHLPGDRSSESRCSPSKSTSNLPSTPTRRGSSRPFASSTPSSHVHKDCNASDANGTPREQWDLSLGLGRSSPASGRRPFYARLNPPSWLSGKPDGIDSDGGVRDPSIRLHDQYAPPLLPSVRTPLNTINPLALSKSTGGSDARSRSSVRYKGRDAPDPFLSKDGQFLPDFVVPDLTHEIRNETLVDRGGYSLVFRADRKKSQGSSTKVAVKILRSPENERGDKILKRLKREALVWKSLNHVNIVPLFGFISGKLGPGLVSPWYSKGNVHQYVQRVPHVRREPLVMPKWFCKCSFRVLTKALSAKMWRVGSDISTSTIRRLYTET
ncbi:hypothetical protein BS47DRAFT_1403079 [Hydnum rufescens UP504]|uniref:Protein kinase domain-containing protein n=1 Tax=Hydnum rufescens UP504 TaxID=1448309 RepID=A0A9P6ACY1_9AGAM|nr:hypothetical protein BS47DRAFT_1403079 [Hydnum rufescens UP504]